MILFIFNVFRVCLIGVWLILNCVYSFFFEGSLFFILKDFN